MWSLRFPSSKSARIAGNLFADRFQGRIGFPHALCGGFGQPICEPSVLADCRIRVSCDFWESNAEGSGHGIKVGECVD